MVISDIVQEPPVLLIVDCSPTKQGFGQTKFDYLDYFLLDSRFAKIWKNYNFISNVEHYRVFKLRDLPMHET